jgi:hypothetical protein
MPKARGKGMKTIICFLMWSAACEFAQAGVEMDRTLSAADSQPPSRLEVGRVPARLNVQEVILQSERELQKRSVQRDEAEMDSLVPAARRHARGLIC